MYDGARLGLRKNKETKVSARNGYYNALYVVCQEQRGTISGVFKKRIQGFKDPRGRGLMKQACVESDGPNGA